MTQTSAPPAPRPVYQNGAGRESPIVENTILESTDYEMFRFDPLNREIDATKIEKMCRSIQQGNWLHLYPIIVNRDMVIIDGQHRYLVAKRLRQPVYYIVSDRMRIEDAAEVNQNVKAWTAADYLAHFCALGLPHYINLRRFLKAHPWLPLSIATRLCHFGTYNGRDGEDAKNLRETFMRGHYIANDIPFATRVCEMAKDFERWFRWWKSAAFLHTVRNLASNADYDHNRMMQKMEWQSTKLVRCANSSDYLALLNEIYNFKVAEARRVQLRKINPGSTKYRADRQRMVVTVTAADDDGIDLRDSL